MVQMYIWLQQIQYLKERRDFVCDPASISPCIICRLSAYPAEEILGLYFST